MWEMKNLFAGIAVTIFALFGVATIIKGDGEPKCNIVNGCAYKVLGKDLCIKEVDVYSVLA